MEAVECFHAEDITLPLQRSTFATMSEAAEAADSRNATALLPGCSYADEPILWGGRPRPAVGPRSLGARNELVSVDFNGAVAAPAGLFQATTNGLAAGNNWHEALLHVALRGYRARRCGAVACAASTPRRMHALSI